MSRLQCYFLNSFFTFQVIRHIGASTHNVSENLGGILGGNVK
jgi:hypothetical protein